MEYKSSISGGLKFCCHTQVSIIAQMRYFSYVPNAGCDYPLHAFHGLVSAYYPLRSSHVQRIRQISAFVRCHCQPVPVGCLTAAVSETEEQIIVTPYSCVSCRLYMLQSQRHHHYCLLLMLLVLLVLLSIVFIHHPLFCLVLACLGRLLLQCSPDVHVTKLQEVFPSNTHLAILLPYCKRITICGCGSIFFSSSRVYN